jgi:LacI family transcriptional regulator
MSKSKTNATTIIDVAKHAHVSVATVGRVIGHYGSVSDKTKDKVLKAVRELNYVPNVLAQGMRKKSTRTLGIIVHNISNFFFASIVEAVEKEASKKDYSLLICNSHENPSIEVQKIELLESRQVDGLLVASAFKKKEDIPVDVLDKYIGETPIVLFDRSITGLNLNSVLTDNYEAAYNAALYLIGLGHKSIAVFGSMRNEIITNTVEERERGFMDAMRSRGLEGLGRIFNIDTSSQEIKEMQISNALENFHFSALIVLNCTLRDTVISILKRNNRSIPEDISLISWDDDNFCQIMGITVVEQPIGSIVKYSFDRLTQLIEEPDENNTGIEIKLKSELKIRNSCRKYIGN